MYEFYIYIILRQFIRYIIIIILSNRIDSLVIGETVLFDLNSICILEFITLCMFSFLLELFCLPVICFWPFDLLLKCSALPWVVEPLATWHSRRSSRHMGDASSKSCCIRTLTLQGNLDLLLGDSDGRC